VDRGCGQGGCGQGVVDNAKLIVPGGARISQHCQKGLQELTQSLALEPDRCILWPSDVMDQDRLVLYAGNVFVSLLC